MTLRDEIKEARQAVVNAESTLRKQSKAALQETLTEVFKNPAIRDVNWGAKEGEYDDEGMIPGVHGPVFNLLDEDGDPIDEHISYNLNLTGYESTSVFGQFATEGRLLKELLTDIGGGVLTELFGEEHIVTAERDESRTTGFRITTEYAGV